MESRPNHQVDVRQGARSVRRQLASLFGAPMSLYAGCGPGPREDPVGQAGQFCIGAKWRVGTGVRSGD
jgi:hypothetical protein